MDKIIFASEIRFHTSRSSGAGGQHVNKTETRVSAIWSVKNTAAFTEDEKSMILSKLAHELINEEYLQSTDQSSRSQSTNKNNAVVKLLQHLEKALKVDKKRIPVSPSLEDIKKRLHIKRKKSETKQNRNYNWKKDM